MRLAVSSWLGDDADEKMREKRGVMMDKQVGERTNTIANPVLGVLVQEVKKRNG
jgi:hypothetical protein